MLEMFIAAITLDENKGDPILVLTDADKQLALPIWISESDCKAIIFALGTVRTERPLTFELLVNLVKSLGAQVLRIDISHVSTTDYVSTITLAATKPGADKEIEVSLDARIADAMVLAIKTGAPIYVSPEVIADAAIYTNAKREREDAEKFSLFVQTVKASDFNEFRLHDR